MSFDKKGLIMLEHYKGVLEQRTFDEYDILSFLIFIREHMTEQYPYINDFCHLIAHRHRDKGHVMTCIKNAILYNYQTKSGSKSIKGYDGMNYSNWKNEWMALGKEFNIAITETIIKETTLCIFSLSQYTEYADKDGYKGKIELFLEPSGAFSLATTEMDKASLYICFFKSPQFSFKEGHDAEQIHEPVETVRIDGSLRLKTPTKFIL